MRIALCAFIALALCGCAVQPQQVQDEARTLSAGIAETQTQLSFADQALTEMRVELDALPPGAERDKALAAIERVEQVKADAEQWMVRAKDKLQTLVDASPTWAGIIEAGGKAAADAGREAGGSAGAVLGLGGALAVALARAWQNRSAARKIAESVQNKIVMSTDADKAAIRKTQGSTGNRIVDEAQGKAMRLPI